jgi:DNA modification methylase
MREALAAMPGDLLDACVTDPPYHLLSVSRNGSRRTNAGSTNSPYARHDRGDGASKAGGFMGAAWDGAHEIAFQPDTWREVYRVLKPGAWLVAMGGTRTYHKLAMAIEDAGFEMRDSIAEFYDSSDAAGAFLASLSRDQLELLERAMPGDALAAWLYGSGFPKSLDVSKAIDKQAGAEREIVGDKLDLPGYHLNGHQGGAAFGHGISSSTPETRLRAAQVTAASTDDAKRWSGWGTALKPAFEPIVIARKPIAARNVAENVLAYGVGAINIDGCRIATGDSLGGGEEKHVSVEGKHEGWQRPWMRDAESVEAHAARVRDKVRLAEQLGRWPANAVLTHSEGCLEIGERQVSGRTINRFTDGAKPFGGGAGHPYESITSAPEVVSQWQCVETCPVRLVDNQSGAVGASAPSPADAPSPPHRNTYGDRKRVAGTFFDDEGGASRFFSNFNGRDGEASAERRYTDNGGTNFAPLPGIRRNDGAPPSRFYYTSKASRSERNERVQGEATNHHPTVKPLDLMRWLCRMVTPLGGTVLDPFAGSGSTLVAALQEGFNALGIEREAEYVSIAQQRIDGVQTGFAWEGPHSEAIPDSGSEIDEPLPTGEDVVGPEQGVMFG